MAQKRMHVAKPKKPEFKMDQAYTWKPNQEVVISGSHFEKIFKTLSERISTPEAQSIIKDYLLHQEMLGVMKREVEEGRFIEQQES